MLISVCASANRPELWMRFYESLTSNSVPFEIVFVGNRGPTFELPENFRFIHSKVKPSQCHHIAIEKSKGEFILTTADDLVYSDGALDKLYQMSLEHDPDTHLYSGRYFGQKGETSINLLKTRDPNSIPPIPPGFLIKKSQWIAHGGIDRRFFGCYWDIDFVMRWHESGKKCLINPNVTVTEHHPNMKKMLHLLGSKDQRNKGDRTFLHNLWLKRFDKPLEEIIPIEEAYYVAHKFYVSKTRLRDLVKYKNTPDIQIREQN